MGDKSPKDIKKRAMKVAQKGKSHDEPRPTPTGGIPETPVKPSH